MDKITIKKLMDKEQWVSINEQSDSKGSKFHKRTTNIYHATAKTNTTITIESSNSRVKSSNG
jgi:hypothetical protein